jgi:hypothetical protein
VMGPRTGAGWRPLPRSLCLGGARAWPRGGGSEDRGVSMAPFHRQRAEGAWVGMEGRRKRMERSAAGRRDARSVRGRAAAVGGWAGGRGGGGGGTTAETGWAEPCTSLHCGLLRYTLK